MDYDRTMLRKAAKTHYNLPVPVLVEHAIRRGDVVNHRRWMIRAFAAGVAVGTIRIWIGLFLASGLLDFHDSFAAAFWIAFSLHVLVGEWWVRTTPPKDG